MAMLYRPLQTPACWPPGPVWWALVTVVVALVVALELVNSAVETVIDRLHPERHEEMRAAKDMLAGAVLLISVAALVVALMLMIDSVQNVHWLAALIGVA